MTERPLLSIVLTSYTTERLNDLYALLHSIRAQRYPDIEIVFVAEKLTELADRVKEYTAKNAMANVKVIFNHTEPGLSATRNLGIREARGNIIAFTDDDVILFPDWAEEMVKTYQDDAIIGVTGPAFPLWQDQSMQWFPKEFYWIISCTAWFDGNELKEVRNAWGDEYVVPARGF